MPMVQVGIAELEGSTANEAGRGGWRELRDSCSESPACPQGSYGKQAFICTHGLYVNPTEVHPKVVAEV